MSKVPLNDRFDRVLRFLLSLNDPAVVGLLAQRGFDAAERHRGWELFETAAGKHLSIPANPVTPQRTLRTLVTELDTWENTWFDVVDATLRHAYPAVHDRLLRNLAKTKGQQVVVTVGTLLARLAEAEADAASVHDDDLVAALELLKKRGLDEACRAQAQALLQALEENRQHESDAAAPDLHALHEKECQQAIDKMWSWYRDWAQIARTVVHGKLRRRSMGLSTRGRPKGSTKSALPATPVTPEAPATPN